jgi:predicted RNA-binding protein YlxR (DUF448 family)
VTRRRHVPLRTCLGCGAIEPQRALVRVIASTGGGMLVDRDRRAGGRGGYLHRNAECWMQFARRKGPVRSLRRVVDRAARRELVETLQRDATANEDENAA